METGFFILENSVMMEIVMNLMDVHRHVRSVCTNVAMITKTTMMGVSRCLVSVPMARNSLSTKSLHVVTVSSTAKMDEMSSVMMEIMKTVMGAVLCVISKM